MTAKTRQVDGFLGINNKLDSQQLGLKWLKSADNVNITQQGGIERRDGYTRKLTGRITGAYTTRDHQRFYFVMDGFLKTLDQNFGSVTLAEDITPQPMYWAEINEQVFFSNGPSKGIIQPDGEVLPWRIPVPLEPLARSAGNGGLHAGMYRVALTFVSDDGREGGANSGAVFVAEGGSIVITEIEQLPGFKTCVYVANANSTVFNLIDEPTGSAISWSGPVDTSGRELVTQFMDAPPLEGVLAAAWRGALYLAEFSAPANLSSIYFSQPLGFHLFDLNAGFIAVPGEVVMLAPVEQALLIGTRSAIYAYDGEKLTTLAQYGAIPGYPASWDEEGQVFIWTERGACRALPFANLTDERISVAPGLRAGGAVIKNDGAKRFVAVLQKGGNAFNQKRS